MSLLCKVADLITEIPKAGGLAPRCAEYLWDGKDCADVIIRTNPDCEKLWSPLPFESAMYMDTGFQFYTQLLKHQGLMLHSSAVEMNGRAYLFSGPCGMGKSTHTRLWQSTFGEAAQVFNDDKPALRRMEDGWYAYGTPWCGKDGINQNKKVPLAGICFLKQAPENKIRRLSKQEAMNKLISQTLYKFKTEYGLDLMLTLVDRLIREIPIFELENRPEPEAAHLSYETMRRAAEEIGL